MRLNWMISSHERCSGPKDPAMFSARAVADCSLSSASGRQKIARNIISNNSELPFAVLNGYSEYFSFQP